MPCVPVLNTFGSSQVNSNMAPLLYLLPVMLNDWTLQAGTHLSRDGAEELLVSLLPRSSLAPSFGVTWSRWQSPVLNA